MDDKEEKIYWLADSKVGEAYETSTYYRCVGIENFVCKVEQDFTVVGVTFSGNNLGFILKKK